MALPPHHGSLTLKFMHSLHVKFVIRSVLGRTFMMSIWYACVLALAFLIYTKIILPCTFSHGSLTECFA